MSALKIVFISGDKQIVLYGQGMKQMWQVESHVLERLGEEDRLNLDTAQFRKFWIDEEGDRVEIMNDVDYEFFLKRAGSHKTPKIYFEARYPTNESRPQQPHSSTQQADASHLSTIIHKGVECDICKTIPLPGFRYKCLQCPNFDVCMKCEGKMEHPGHLMIRIPNHDTSLWEAIYPLTMLIGAKRRQRKCTAAAVAAAAARANAGVGAACGEGAQGEGKSRHHRHHRRHCNGGTGLWSNFYDMMQDLAEGGAVPRETAPTEGPQIQGPVFPPSVEEVEEVAAAVAAAAGISDAANGVNSRSKETNTSPDRTSTSATGTQSPPRNSAFAPPSFENLQNLVDPNLMKAGFQILSNFSEMFGKILDPVVTADSSNANSTPESVIIDIDLTGESRASATPPPTDSGTPKESSGSKVTTPPGSGIVTPMETEVTPHSPQPTAPEVQPRSRNSHSDENDWTMIDSTAAQPTAAEATTFAAATTSAAAATTSAAAATTATTAPVVVSPTLDFTKLSIQLQSHIENEMKDQSHSSSTPVAIPSPVTPPTPAAVPIKVPVTPPTPTPVAVPFPVQITSDGIERRAVAVYHPDPRINNAVHAMMAMGFSNEGAILTQLLSSVNGSIPLALDLMTNAQRN